MTEKTTPTIRPKLDKYVGVRTASGTKSKSCGDEVSQALAGTTLEEAFALVAAVTGGNADELAAKYKHLNPGQQRMNAGNVIRGVLNSKDEAKAAKGRTVFTKQSAALAKVVAARLKDIDAKQAQAKKDAQKARDDKKAAAAKERADKAAERKKAADAKKEEASKPKAKPLPAKAKAPKAPAKPAAKKDKKAA